MLLVELTGDITEGFLAASIFAAVGAGAFSLGDLSDYMPTLGKPWLWKCCW